MSPLPVRFHPEARTEFDEAINWYAARGTDLAEDFVAKVDVVLERIARHPMMHAAVYRDARKATVARFPYVIVYREFDGEIIVLGVRHTSRDDTSWQQRL